MAPTTYPPYLREKARQLRRDRKLTIDQLAECLALPRTTIYYWVRDLRIPQKSICGLAGIDASSRKPGDEGEVPATTRRGLRGRPSDIRVALPGSDVPRLRQPLHRRRIKTEPESSRTGELGSGGNAYRHWVDSTSSE